ncbi:MAG: hypothetical protein HY397_03760 [Candidatus Doudnabacteria bacterium]|nr:hypothetical protein [Candidatus Doudnabacteria bacterium]
MTRLEAESRIDAQEGDAEAIVKKQTREFLAKLAGPSRKDLSIGDYQLYLQELQKEVDQLTGTERGGGDRVEIEDLRNRILKALNPVYEGHWDERSGRSVWMAHGDSPVPMAGDQDYERKMSKIRQLAKGLAVLSSSSDVVDQDSSRILHSLASARQELLKTPRGLLYDLYARLDKHVGNR